jgi:hypothetical protein
LKPFTSAAKAAFPVAGCGTTEVCPDESFITKFATPVGSALPVVVRARHAVPLLKPDNFMTALG